jgi:hypothetical protein
MESELLSKQWEAFLMIPDDKFYKAKDFFSFAQN